MMKFRIAVTETYSKYYEIEAESEAEAMKLAENKACDDLELAIPENMDSRDTEVTEILDYCDEDDDDDDYEGIDD